jgi:tetratricopeptide (TPR) repeat protein/TolB-like protein
MRSPSKYLALACALSGVIVCLSASFPAAAQNNSQTAIAEPAGRVVLVLPFTNRSGDPTLNWIGDSFPDTLNKRLNSAGFLTISRDDRAFAYNHLGLPEDFQPSRATTIRIAQQLDANFVIIGSYSVQPLPLGQSAADTSAKSSANPGSRISVQAQVLSVDRLQLSSPVEDSAELSRLFDAQNAIAWKVARALDPHFNVAEPTFLAAPGSVALPAFEDYIRGTNAQNPAERLKRLESAVALVPDYPAALLALGKEQYAQRLYPAAAATLAKLPHSDRLALEANFYLGLARFNTANYAGAAEAFAFVATSLPLPEILNNQAVALSRQGKDAAALFQRASAADPSDQDYHYNLAIAYFRRGDTANALAEASTALSLKPNDPEAAALNKQLATIVPGTRLTANSDSSFTPVERVRRNYSETSFRQAAFQLDQLRAARLALLPADQRATQYTQLGHEYLAQGLLPEAESQFQSAINANPNSAEAHVGLAQIRDFSGDGTQARSEANASIKLHPSAAAWMVLARLDLAAAQYLNCAEDVAHAQQLEPNNSAAIAMRNLLVSRGQWVPNP